MTKEEAIQVLQTALTSPFVYGEYADAISMAIEALTDRLTGEWINREKCQVDEDAYEVATCSECGAEITIEYPHDSYCPNCGTKMNKMRADDGYGQ